MSKINYALGIFFIFFLFSFDSQAQVAQGFEGITAQNLGGACLYEDPDAVSTHVLQNFNDPDCGLITVMSTGAGSVLGFQNIYSANPAQGTDGFSDGDAFGVANNASLMSQLGAVAPEGTQAFLSEDPDGNVSMEFDFVNLAGTSTPMVSVQYFAAATTYEAPDFLTITVEITGCGAATTLTLVDIDTPAEFDAIEGAWQTTSANLTAFVGCTAQLKIGMSTNSSAEELGIDNIIFTEGVLGAAPPPAVCPMIGAVSTTNSDVCLSEGFDLTATGLAIMDMASNNEADFGIQFVAFPAPTAAPYVGGVPLGTVPFGSLTGGGTIAMLTGATIPFTGNFSVYAILSPSPLDAACRPTAVTTVMVSGCDVSCDPTAGVTTSFETIFPQPLDGGVGSCTYVDADAVSTHIIQNINSGCGPITVNYGGFGTTLGFEIEYSANAAQGTDGLTDGDNIGVAGMTTITSEVGAGPTDGNAAFLMEDTDGNLAMNFDIVDLTGTTNPMFSMDFILSETTWEVADFLNIYIDITGCGAATTVTLINVSGTAMDGVEGSWMTLSTDLTPYIGCMAQLVVEFSSSAASEELAIDNIVFTEGCLVGSSPPIVCPSIGATTISESLVCLNDPFDVSVSGLVNMDMAGNTDQDYGIAFVAFPAATTIPYVGGTVLGTVPFAGLTNTNTEAAITAASLGMTGTFQVYAILSPTPLDGSCRPSSVSTITVEGCNELCDVTASIGTSFETIVGQNLGGACVFTDPDLTMHTLMNTNPACGPITVDYGSFGSVLGFENIFTPSANGVDGFSDGDAFGVANTASVTSNTGMAPTDGDNAFLMEDIDGNITMNFDPITLTGTTASMFSMDYILSSTSWEDGDFLNIHIEITGCAAATSISLINVMGAAMDGVEGTWNTLTADLTPYVGCTAQLVVEFSSDAASEELAIDNIVFTEGCIIMPIVCPTIGAVSSSDATVCVNEAFDITATGLVTMDMVTNMEQDFGVEFLYFGNATTDPYTGGTSLGTVPFGSLTGGNSTAALTGASIPFVDPTGFIYAILSPAPFNPDCRPFAETTIEVLSIPTVDVTLPETYCVDAGIVTAGPLVAPTAMTTVYSGTGVTDDGNNSTFQFDVTSVGVGVHPVSVTLTNANGCPNTLMVNITVLALPTVSFTAPADLCLNSGVQAGLGGGTPPQGTALGDMGVYSGAGVTDDGNGMTYSFDPAAAGVGTHTITYTYTDENGCTNSASDDVQVFAIPNALFTALADLCVNDGVQAGLSGGTPTGGVYSGTGVTDDGNGMTYSFDPAAAGVGTHTITYSVGVAGCDDSAMDDVEVFDLPTVSLSTALGYCTDAPITTVPLVGGSPSGGVYSGLGVTDLGNGISYNLDPTINGPGILTVSYTFTDANGCSNTATSDIELFDCNFEVLDPCNCLDNATIIDLDNGTGGTDGQFSEVVTITGGAGVDLPPGQTWTVVAATGVFDENNVPAIGTQSAGIPIATDGTVTLTNVGGGYEIPFVHIDAMGYTISIEGPFGMGSPANVTLSVGNNCSYPNPTFDPALMGIGLCIEDDAITLGVSEPSGVGADGVTYTINGMAATEFDPAVLGGGDHVVVMTYDGADDGNGGIAPMGGTAYPGCIQEVTQTINVNPICCEPPADVTPLEYQICEQTDAVDSDGNGMTEDGLPIMEVINPDPMATYLWFGPSTTPPVDPFVGSIVSGTSFTPTVRPGVGNTDTYWVVGQAMQGGNTCYNNPVAITLTEQDTPNAPTVVSETLMCAGDAVSPIEVACSGSSTDVQWYDAATGGTLQGTGAMFDPTGTNAEEAAFDNSTPGVYTYYAECEATYENGCTETFVDRIFDSESEFSGSETLIDFEDIDAMGSNLAILGTEYSSQGVNISSPFELAISELGSPCGSVTTSGVNALTNYDVSCDQPIGALQFDFLETINRVGFQIYNNSGDQSDITITCLSSGQLIGQETVNPNGAFVFFGLESMSGFDQVLIEVSGTFNNAIIIDDLRFEGCTQTIPNPLMCESTRVPVTVTIIQADDPSPMDYQICSETDFVDSNMDGSTEDVLPEMEIGNPDPNATYQWFGPSVAPPGPSDVAVGTGTSFTPTTRPGEGNTDIYWVICTIVQNGLTCESNPVPFTLTEQMTPEPPEVINEPVLCSGSVLDPLTDFLEAECAEICDEPTAVYLRSDTSIPWGLSGNEDAMNTTFGMGAWQDLRYESVDVAALLSPNTTFIFMEGGDATADEMEAFLNANLPAIEAWVNAGGNLLINAAPNEGNGMNYGFGGVQLTYPGSFSNGSAANPAHPIFNGPNLPAGPGLYIGSSFSHGIICPPGMSSVIVGSQGETLLAESAWGAGIVMFGGLTLPFFTSHPSWTQPNSTNLHANILEYLRNSISCVEDGATNWYDAATGGNLQGTGTPFDPTGTNAEEGAFDINTPGTYTYYAECKANFGDCPETYTDRIFTSDAEFSGSETYIHFDELFEDPLLNISNFQYLTQGLTISSPPGGDFSATNISFGPPNPSPNMGLINIGALDIVPPYEGIIFDFTTTQNRVGFFVIANPGTLDLTITCTSSGNVIGQQIFTVTNTAFTYVGFESAAGFDQIFIEASGTANEFIIDDLRFEGCEPSANPDPLMCESERSELVYTVVGYENVTASQVCNFGTAADPQDYDIELCFDVLQGGPSGMFDVFVNDGIAPNMTNIDEYNGAASTSFPYSGLGTSIDGTASNCVLLSAADLDAADLSTVTVSIIDWDIANMMNVTNADLACSSVTFEEFLCCAADAGTQPLGPIEVCTDVATGLAPAGTTGNIEITFNDLPNQPGIGLYNYAWIITDMNLDIVNVVASANYNVATPANFADDILLNDATGTMLGIGTYCIHGISYLDAANASNAGVQGAVDLATLQTLVGMNAVDVAPLLAENDGVSTPVGANGTFTFCADLNVAGCTPVTINPTPEITANPEDMYQCEGDDAIFTATGFVLPGDHLDPSPSSLTFTLEWSQDDGLTWTEFTGATANPAQPIIGPTGTETVTFTVPAVNANMNCSLWRIVLTADHNPDPDCFSISETAKLYVHGGGAMSCNDRVNFSLDQNCEINPTVNDFYEGDYDTCGDDEIAYMNAFFRVEFETKEGEPVPADELGDQLGYGDGCLFYSVIDNCTGNSCWGEICIEDKLPPELECDCPPGSVTVNPDGSFTGPAQCIIECHDVDRYMDGRRGTPDVLDNCDTESEPSFSGAQIDDLGNCTYKITQVWSLTVTSYPSDDTQTASCINEYYVDAPSLDDVECPDDVVYECDEVDSPHLTHPDETGYPTLWNQDIKSGNIDSYCSIFATWDDVEIPACGPACYGTNKILRTWTILDWCNNETITCNQVIKVEDSTDPTIDADDIVVSTDAWICSADIWFDDPLMHDNCTYDLDYEIAWSNSGALLVDDEGKPITQNDHGLIQHAMAVPKGTWSFILKTTDCCGNIGYDTISVTVIDDVAPVAVAKQNIVVSLTGAYPEATAKVLCESINNGSHDNCSGVWCEIRRDSDPCDIEGNLTYSNKIPEFCDPWYDDDDHDYGQHVKFCCEDAMADGDGDGEVDGMVKVWMRVWDDANMDGEYGSWTFYDNPGNDHDYCEFNDNYNETWVYVTVEDKAPESLICPPDVTIPCHWDYTDLSLTGEAITTASCSHPHVAYLDWPEIHCGEGYVLREWFVDSNNNGEMDSDEGEYPCVQRITIEYVDSPLEVVCPDFEDFEDVEGNPDLLWFDPFNTNHVSVDCEGFEFPEPWQSGGKCNLIGVSSTIDTFWFEQDACFKAIKTWDYVDWCTDETFTCNFVVSLVDTEPPTVTAQDTCYPVNDYWDADGDWNFCEMTSDVDVCAIGDDMGECPSEWIKWVAEVDLWYDGNVDLTYSSFLPHNDDFYVAPTPRGEKVSIELDKDDITAEWAIHFIEWKAFDGCGNVAQTHQYVEVADKKAPTPYCIGISTALMSPEAGNLVELWAIDFNLGSFDNCTTEDHLKYTFGGVPPVAEKLDEVHCFKPVWENEDLCAPMTDENGVIISEEVNNCNGYENGATDPMCQIQGIQRWNPDTKSSGMKFVGTDWCGEWDIKVAVWDTKLNMDYCYVTLVVHGVECGTLPRNISGTILTEAGEPVAQAEVTNASSFITGGEMSMMTQEDGIYAFTSNVEGGDYAITSYRNNDFLNGVSTLDMVLIQKHILSLVSFDSPYKVVAADINNDESVTAVDLTELRKLILGVYTALPSNTSWRFVDSDQTLSLTNPWPLNESVNITNLSSDMMTEDFIGVKVGDVNGTAISSFNGNGTETRSNIKLDFVLEKTALGIQIKAGGNFSDIYGYQFTSRINGNITNVESGSINVGFENFGLLGNGIMTTSYASEVPISVVEGDILFELQGLTDLNLIDGFTPAEAYVNDALDVVGVSMREVNQTIEFSLGQNEPNPFIDKTTIPFSIGAEGDITLTIYELSGKVVKVIEGRYESGNHTVKLDKKDLGLTGVLYYKIECGDFIQARKMIILE